MAKSKVKVSKLRRQLRRVPKEMRTDIKATMKAVGVDLEAAVKANAPVDEGRLKRATHHKVSNDGLGVTVGYSKTAAGFKRKWKKGGFTALWAQFGTKRTRATKFLTRAWRSRLASNMQRIERDVVKSLHKITTTRR
jgi:hypothetical protein